MRLPQCPLNFIILLLSSEYFLESPKSIILGIKFISNIILPGFISKWHIFLLWQYSIPFTIFLNITLAYFSERLFGCFGFDKYSYKFFIEKKSIVK